MDKKVIEILTGDIKEYYKPGPGRMKFRYVKGEDVISRLNLAFDHNWSSRVEKVTESGNQIIVLISIEAGGATHHGFGGAEVAVYNSGHQKAGQPVDISNSYKAAYTNALKKAAEQFGVGLQSEDDFVPENTASVPTHSAPPAPAAAPSGPVSGSATFSTAKPTSAAPPQNLQALMANVDMEVLQKQVQSMLATAPAVAPESAPVPAPKPSPESFAKTFKDQHTGYSPEESRQPEVANPFPATPADAPLNDFQLNALGGLAKMKKITPDKAINMGLPNSTKTKYEELTKDEAKAVIQALNGLEG